MRTWHRIPWQKVCVMRGVRVIIFNEKEYVEKNCFKKDYRIDSTEELCRLLRYYAAEGKDAAEVRSEILKFDCTDKLLEQIVDDYNFAALFLKANSRPLRTTEPIWVTKYEYDFVAQVDDVEKEKILFFMIFMQKFLRNNVFRLTAKEIKKSAMTQLTIKEIGDALDELAKGGFIESLDKKKFKVNTNYISVIKSENYLCVDDYNRIVAPYLRTKRTLEFFYCENCGRRTLYRKNDEVSHFKRKYCKKCSRDVKNHVSK